MITPISDRIQITEQFDFQTMTQDAFDNLFTNRYIWDDIINQEWQHYVQRGELTLASPFTLDIDDGLIIEARKRDIVNERFTQQPYLSGLISTHGKQKGILPPTSAGPRRVSAFLSLPVGVGVWPAWWFLPEFERWPELVRVLPEIDAMEYIGEGGRYYSTVHTYGVANPDSRVHTLNQDQYTHNCPLLPLDQGNWYHFERDEQHIKFGFNDLWVKQVLTPPDLQGPLHMNLNLAVGGTWPGIPVLDAYEFKCRNIVFSAPDDLVVIPDTPPRGPNRDVMDRLERIRREMTGCVNDTVNTHLIELE